MSRFVDIAIEKQYSANSVYQARKNLDKSCTICTYHGYNISCKQCHIQGAYETVIKNLLENKTA